MRVNKSIIINKPAQDVWKVLAHDFDKASDWMAAVPNSHKIEGKNPSKQIPMTGRVCELSTKFNGPRADERITSYNEDNMTMQFVVTPINAPFPIHKNIVDVQVKSLAINTCEVVWNTNADLKFMGYVMYPMLKVGLRKTFNEILEELKIFIEEGKPHPRKLKKMKAA